MRTTSPTKKIVPFAFIIMILPSVQGFGIPMLPHTVYGHAVMKDVPANGTMEVLIDGVVFGRCEVDYGKYTVHCNGKSAAQDEVKDGGEDGDLMYFILITGNGEYLSNRTLVFEYGGISALNLSFNEKITPLKINEVSPWTQTVEIYNPTEGDVSISDWRIEDCDGYHLPLKGSIPPKGKIRFKLQSGFLETSGDEVKLSYLSDTLKEYIVVDRVEYGFQRTMQGNTSLPDFPDIPAGKCIRRIQDGYDTDDCMKDFFLCSISESEKEMCVIEGYVSDENGMEIYGVNVSAEHIITETDFTGSYAMHLPKGNHTIIFSRYGYEEKTMKLNVQSDMHLNVTLKRKVSMHTIYGTVTDEHGMPVLSATVTAGHYSTETDAFGRFTIDLPDEHYEVIISKENFSAYTSEIMVKNDVEMNVVLHRYTLPNATCFLNVNVFRDGKGVKGALVIIKGTGKFCETDGDGRAFFELPEGNYTIEVRYDGVRESMLEGVEVSNEYSTSANFNLSKKMDVKDLSFIISFIAFALFTLSAMILLLTTKRYKCTMVLKNAHDEAVCGKIRFESKKRKMFFEEDTDEHGRAEIRVPRGEYDVIIKGEDYEIRDVIKVEKDTHMEKVIGEVKY